MTQIMDEPCTQCAKVGSLHLETQCMENKWEWSVRDTTNNMRLASGVALSMEKAKAQAAQAAGTKKPKWYTLPN
jgi:hypothetical protein